MKMFIPQNEEVVHIPSIYLDNAATTPLPNSVKGYIISLLDNFYNPSSLYQSGQGIKQIISNARQTVAKFINASHKDIYFTPSGSASNTLAIKGYYEQHNCTVLYSPIAHKSILKCVEDYKNSYPLNVDQNGFINYDDLKEWLDTRNINPFIIIDYANSEIGTVQDVRKIVELVHFYNGIVYLDCTGSISQIPIDVKSLDVDMIGFSAHKLGGLKGCGVLYKKKKIEISPLVYGSQEAGLIGGTENVLGIASLGKAVEDHEYSSITSDSRDHVYNYIIKNIPDCYLVGAPIESGNRLPHNLYVCFKGIEGESLMILLDMNGIEVSTGSACNSGSLSASPTLTAIGIDKKDINSCIRISFSGHEPREDIDSVCQKIKKCVESLRSMNN